MNKGHLDKLRDQSSDAVRDTCLRKDPKSEAACETTTESNMLMDAGETATQAKVDYDVVVRKIYKGIGFTSYVDDLSSAFRTKTSLHVGGLVLCLGCGSALYVHA